MDNAFVDYRVIEMTDIAGFTSVLTDDDGNKISTITDLAGKRADVEVTNQENPPGDYGVSFTKKALGGDELEGAKMVLKDAQGNVIESWTSTKEAYELELPEGEYVLIETAAPEGYQCVTTEIGFKVDEYGKVTLKTTTVDNGGKVTVMEGNNIVLEDAPNPVPDDKEEEEPTPEGGEKEETPSTEDKEKEKEEHEDKPAPAPTPTSETKRSTPAPVVPQSTQRRVVSSGNTRATSTGDSNNAALWIIISSAAAAAIAGLAISLVRRKKRYDD